MTDDRELLRLAAKAAGLEPFRAWGNTFVMGDGSPPRAEWNPLEDDGDAFRLLVRMGLFWKPELSHFLALERFACQDRDDCHAHRRAIVCAAAALAS